MFRIVPDAAMLYTDELDARLPLTRRTIAVITGGGAAALPPSLLPAGACHEHDLVLQGLNLLR